MSITRPTAGELWDRWCLLCLKTERAAGAHFALEQREILERLRGKKPADGVPPLVRELDAIHRQLWGLLDIIAAAADGVAGDHARVADTAIAVFRLNQKRVFMREAIDRLCGDYQGPEKV